MRESEREEKRKRQGERVLGNNNYEKREENKVRKGEREIRG